MLYWFHMTIWNIDANAKTVKGQKLGYQTGIIYLAPGDLSGHQVCAGASKECLAFCLNTSGMGAFSNVQNGRINKTKKLFENREKFIAQALKELDKACAAAVKSNLVPVFRPNGTSDLPWLAKALHTARPNVQFYDYTKLDRPWERVSENYHLTYSFSGDNMEKCLEALKHGVNVAVVFDKLPKTHWGYPVVNGDETDLRFLDAKGVIVGLKAKGKARNKKSEFIQIG